MQKTIVIALGGNSIVRANEKGTYEEQYSNLRQTGEHLLGLLGGENRVVITHGNGPQIGNLLLACEAIKDSTRGYRRVVPSPRPLEIQQARIIRSMLDAGEIVIAVGGGIPSVRERDRSLQGIEAVIDKDYVSSRLAIDIDADTILFLTAVEKVYRDFGLPSQKALGNITVAETKELLAEGQFGVGSIEPKIRAAIKFLQEMAESAQPPFPHQKREVIITLPETVTEALEDKTGTRITL